jgi:hypothetical protein
VSIINAAILEHTDDLEDRVSPYAFLWALCWDWCGTFRGCRVSACSVVKGGMGSEGWFDITCLRIDDFGGNGRVSCGFANEICLLVGLVGIRASVLGSHCKSDCS